MLLYSRFKRRRNKGETRRESRRSGRRTGEEEKDRWDILQQQTLDLSAIKCCQLSKSITAFIFIDKQLFTALNDVKSTVQTDVFCPITQASKTEGEEPEADQPTASAAQSQSEPAKKKISYAQLVKEGRRFNIDLVSKVTQCNVIITA